MTITPEELRELAPKHWAVARDALLAAADTIESLAAENERLEREQDEEAAGKVYWMNREQTLSSEVERLTTELSTMSLARDHWLSERDSACRQADRYREALAAIVNARKGIAFLATTRYEELAATIERGRIELEKEQ